MPCYVFCLLLILVYGLLPSQVVAQHLSAYRASRQAALSAAQRRIDASLRRTAALVQQYGAAASRMVTRSVHVQPDGTVDVYIHLNALTAAQLQALQRHVVRIRHVDWQARVVDAAVRVDALEALTALDVVDWVGTPSYARRHTGSVTSEGDDVLQARTARERFEVSGRGVRIGIISDSLVDWQDAAERDDLPFFIVRNCVDFADQDTSCIFAGHDGSAIPDQIPGQLPTDEGRAMAEIIHDLAPDANLIFHTGFSTSMDMRAAIRALVEAKVDIIVDDLGFPAEPVFEDGPIAQQVQGAIDTGVVYVTAAGNDAQNHYRGMYQEFDPHDNDPDVNLHDFGAGDTTLTLVMGPGRPGNPSSFSAFLQWPDRFDGGANTADYDLLLYDASGQHAACDQNGLSGVCISDNRQLQSQAPPIESVTLTNTTPAFVTVTLLINRVAGPALPLAINFLGDVTPREHRVARGSVFGHPCVPDALAVGAIDATDAAFDTIEPFSSHGPCEVFFPAFAARSKPDLVAADGVMTSLANFSPFFGTSAAAPHVAAIAALLIDAGRQVGQRELSPTQIVDVLRTTAVDIGAAGIDPASGYGYVDALRALVSGQDLYLQAMTNHAPRSSVVLPADDTVVVPGTAVTFQGVCTDIDVEDGDALTFRWDFGAVAPVAAHLQPGAVVFSEPGVFPVTFTCTDAAGSGMPTTRRITVDQPPVGRIDAPSAARTVSPGEQVDFMGSCQDADDHLPVSFLWTFGGGADRERANEPDPSVLFQTPGTYTVTLICTDALGIADPLPPTIQVRVMQVDSGGGGGCGTLLIPPSMPGDPPLPLAALGNIFLPLIVMLALRVWRRFRALC